MEYQTELEKAVMLATYIPSVDQWKFPTFQYLGTVHTPYGNRHYYYDKTENKYYVEGDIDREMRAAIRRGNTRKIAKK